MGSSLRELRADAGADQTLQNLIRVTTLNLELRARYRVFEFEARRDGHDDTAALFEELRRVEGEQTARLLDGLRTRLLTASPADRTAQERGAGSDAPSPRAH